MKVKTNLCGVLVAIAAMATAAEAPKGPVVGDHRATALLHQDDFEKDLSQWVVEQQPGGSVKLEKGALDIDDRGGCTVWFKHKLDAPVLIAFDVTMVQADGPNDQVSDLNAFTMAIDPKHPEDIFARSKERQGKFKNYHHLRLYYVGYGANRNTTARFRRYPGDGTRPVKPEHDLKAKHKPNQVRHVQILVAEGRYQYWVDGAKVFDVADTEPFTSGWFAFRTVRNHMKIDRFRVWRLGRK